MIQWWKSQFFDRHEHLNNRYGMHVSQMTTDMFRLLLSNPFFP